MESRKNRQFVLLLLVVALIWIGGGLAARGQMLAAWRNDYETAALAKDHPLLVRFVVSEATAQAAERFARHYDGLENSNVLTAPIHAALTVQARSDYIDAVNGAGRAKESAPVGQPGPWSVSVPRGVRVDSVAAGSRADLAGLCVGDVIIRYNSLRIASLADLNGARDGAAGFFPMRVPVVVLRDGGQVGLSIESGTLGVTCSER